MGVKETSEKKELHYNHYTMADIEQHIHEEVNNIVEKTEDLTVEEVSNESSTSEEVIGEVAEAAGTEEETTSEDAAGQTVETEETEADHSESDAKSVKETEVVKTATEVEEVIDEET